MSTTIIKNPKILLSVLAIVLLALLFWGGSRYPSLNEKASMAGELLLEDPLGFESAIQIDRGASVTRKIVVTFINWVVTNWKGMTFGILFAAAFMSLLSQFKRRPGTNVFKNSLLGMSMGAPLGVCVNCAAPIARGMHRAGSRLETTLTMLISSPSLNVLVVIMLFTLFPPYMAITRVLLILLLVLVLIPLLSKYLFKGFSDVAIPLGENCDVSDDQNAYRSAFLWFIRSYAQNLWFILKTTVPLMLLAGLLGAALITVLPWDTLVQNMDGSPWWKQGMFLLGLGLIGLFLPVPIAFDVFICASLLSAGMREQHVMILLMTLGSFSIYSFLIIGRYIAWKVSATISILLLVLALGAGQLAGQLSVWYEANKIERFLTAFSDSEALPHQPLAAPQGDALVDLKIQVGEERQLVSDSGADMPPGLSLAYRELTTPTRDEQANFSKLDGLDYGFELWSNAWLPHQYILPFSEIAAIAAGDVHNDGWPDLLVNSGGKLFLYANIDGQEFRQQEIDIPGQEEHFTGAIALVDLDNDGWMDIFFSSFLQGNYVLYNQQGEFRRSRLTQIKGIDSNIAHAIAFADIDHDGMLEGALGSFTAGQVYLFLEESKNYLLDFSGNDISVSTLPGMPGETLSLLFEDLNNDQYPELLVGNDYQIPDVIYDNNAGKLELPERGPRLDTTTYSTMSISSADIDNDLQAELYFGQITGSVLGDHDALDLIDHKTLCEGLSNDQRRALCERNLVSHEVLNKTRLDKEIEDLFGCKALADSQQRLDCVAVELFLTARRNKQKEYCQLFPQRWQELAQLCNYLEKKGQRFTGYRREHYPFQNNRENQLFSRRAGQKYKNIGDTIGATVAGWGWNSKFADLDNDQWQDLFVVNGYYNSQRRESNILFQNDAGRMLSDQTSQWGLSDHMATGAYAYIDYDRDGDMDIITVPFQSPPWIYRNNTRRNSLMFELRDRAGNHYGIGSKLVIYYADGKSQMRYIKASGGYFSMDEPLAHFGLDTYAQIDKLEITWSTGETSTIEHPFSTGRLYRISRDKR